MQSSVPSTTRRHAPDHEELIHHHDPATGLRALVAIHSTVLGPALGGTRFHPYPDEESAVYDVLALSRAMTSKSAAAGLDLGGGKAVIIGDPRERTEAMMRAYGRFLASLDGRYITACDVGTTVADMDLIAQETEHVVGRSTGHGGSGDSSELTAYGVLQAMRAAVQESFGSPDLGGRRIGIEGVGKVGLRLAVQLTSVGAQVVLYDVSPDALRQLPDRLGPVEIAAGPAELRAWDLDIYAPCGMAHDLDEADADTLSARIVCGGANNPLTGPAAARALHDRGILYVPDFIANAGGLIQVADELEGFSMARARRRATGIRATTTEVLKSAAQHAVPPTVAATWLVEDRLANAGARKAAGR